MTISVHSGSKGRRRVENEVVMADSWRVVAFDPGLRLTGYAVLEVAGTSKRLVEAGVLRIPEKQPLPRRIQELYRGASELLAEHRPTWVAIEQLYSHYERPRTAILMGHGRGVLLLAAAEHDAEVASYLPSQVKKATTGSGRASKQQMQRAIQAEFNLPAPPDPPDIADALAVALCHVVHHATTARLAG